jgi:hypothetical protein
MPRRRTLTRQASTWAAAAASALVVTITTAPLASAQGTKVGSVAIVAPTNNKTLLELNTAQTSFGLVPPSDARCSGSSQKNGYFVTAYLTTNDPSTLTVDADGPHSTSGTTYPLIDSTRSQYVQRNTAPPGSTSNGQGEVPPSGPMTWLDFRGTLKPGVYHVGLMCTGTNNGVVTLDRYWDNEITVTADPKDAQGFLWQVTGDRSAVARTTSGSSNSRMIAVGAVVTLAALVVVVGRRRKPTSIRGGSSMTTSGRRER